MLGAGLRHCPIPDAVRTSWLMYWVGVYFLYILLVFYHGDKLFSGAGYDDANRICIFRQRLRCIFSSTLMYLSVLLHSLMLSSIVVQILKVVIGEKRPHFFYACDYKGYR